MGSVMARRARDAAGATRARVGVMDDNDGWFIAHRVRGCDAREDAPRWRRRGPMGGVPAAGALRPGRGPGMGSGPGSWELGVGSWEW